jgi:hypothetical protein
MRHYVGPLPLGRSSSFTADECQQRSRGKP